MSFLPAELPHTAARGANFAQAAAKLATQRLRERMRESRLSDDFHPQDDDEFVAAVHFAGDLSSVYQLEQWLWPFEQLETHLKDLGHNTRPFVIIVRYATVAENLKIDNHFTSRFTRLTNA